MRKLFFFGTMRHLPLLEIVTGQRRETLLVTPETLPGFAVFAVAEGPFPMIRQDAGAVADGLLVEGLSAESIARLDYYEAAFGYRLAKVSTADGQDAETYLPPEGRWTADGPWDLLLWEKDWADLSCLAAKEVMTYFGQRPAEDVGRIFSSIRARAASRLTAQQATPADFVFRGDVRIAQQRRVYSEYFALDQLAVSYDLIGGGRSEVLERSAVVAADVAIVLPYDPVRDRVLLVEQIRFGPLLRGDPAPWQIEPVAGRIDPGETPQQAARREAEEEAGVTLDRLETVAEVYPTPGTSSEFYFIFVGLADLSDSLAGAGGLAEEHEDIRVHLLQFDALMTLAADHKLANAPIVTCAYWLAHHRDRLRLESAGDTSGSD